MQTVKSSSPRVIYPSPSNSIFLSNEDVEIGEKGTYVSIRTSVLVGSFVFPIRAESRDILFLDLDAVRSGGKNLNQLFKPCF
jgi:hypothetical protein